MTYAVIATGGKQYRVEEGQVLEVDRLENEAEESFTLEPVLMARIGEAVLIGDPYLKNVAVKAKVLAQTKGKKIDVMKFKAKVRYRKKIGFRPYYSKILIEKIVQSGKKK